MLSSAAAAAAAAGEEGEEALPETESRLGFVSLGERAPRKRVRGEEEEESGGTGEKKRRKENRLRV